ncbi:hypothetical protein WP8W19C03_31150 [Aeromonas veronii]|nr:hypothetical protein WP8W19C03_31150 [Aeromonas veronii]
MKYKNMLIIILITMNCSHNVINFSFENFIIINIIA